MIVSDIGERALIGRIRRRIPPAPPSRLLVGIGDDAAVAVPERGALQILTTDALVEGIHFDRRFSTPADIGYKALAVNVSDVAAMGGVPRLALLSLILPGSIAVDDVEQLVDGLLELARSEDIAVAGGNIARSPGPLVVDVTVTGTVKARKVLTRGGGRAGQRLYITGTIGAAAAGLAWLRRHAADPDAMPQNDPALAECVRRHRRPEPRTRLGSLLGRNRVASACVDLSDGLGDAVRQIAEASGTGARIDASRLPVHPGAVRWFETAGVNAADAAINGGDDYELLFTLSGRRRGALRAVERLARGVPLTPVGELTSDRVITLMLDGVARELGPGFSHF